ncbi:MAG: hypothetical protein AUG02_02770 [Chloroflexi bacterium 13_1_20CM_2_70_9]|nr:MAG: hypothetical protein AUG02_02770 [Chloroflexi bacterium 13_1_20CM_2_70_9]
MRPPVDPARGTLLVAPPGAGFGRWAGAPGAYADGDVVYLVYRLRWPRPVRGAELVVARGDGTAFVPIWRATRDDFASPSIERCAIARENDRWRLYVSYVDGRSGRWRIDLLEADAPDRFDPATRTATFTAENADAVAVKDPWLRRVAGRWLMFVSYGTVPDDLRGIHAGEDALSTGLTRSETGLAESADGLRWTWRGRVLAAGKGWDRFTARLATAVSDSEGGWLGLYDGSASLEENYEERCGLARSPDLRRWERLGDGPGVGAAGGPTAATSCGPCGPREPASGRRCKEGRTRTQEVSSCGASSSRSPWPRSPPSPSRRPRRPVPPVSTRRSPFRRPTAGPGRTESP